MNQYTLAHDEVVLFKGSANFNGSGTSSEVFLTNLNLVQITRTKKLFAQETIDIKTYPTDEIKVYNGTPQVKQLGGKVEMYFTSTELMVDFGNLLIARKFVGIVYDFVSGTSGAQRSAEKVRGAVGVIDTALGINTIGTVAGMLGKSTPASILGGLAKAVLSQPAPVEPEHRNQIKNINQTSAVQQENAPSLSLDEQIEALKKLKELLDAGIITQDEFDKKKAQIMNL